MNWNDIDFLTDNEDTDELYSVRDGVSHRKTHETMLEDYYTQAETDAEISSEISTAVPLLLEDYYTQAETDAEISSAISTAVASAIEAAYPVGTLRNHPTDLPGTEPLAPNWQLCDGSLISDAASPYNGRRVFNLTGASVELSLDWTADGAGSYAILDEADVFAVSEGDTVAGGGIDAECVVLSIDPATREIVVTQTDLAGEISTTFSNEGLSVVGGANDNLSQADCVQRMTGNTGYILRNVGTQPSGAFTVGNNTSSDISTTGGNNSRDMDFYSANSPNARTSAETYGRTKPHARKMPVYIKIKH